MYTHVRRTMRQNYHARLLLYRRIRYSVLMPKFPSTIIINKNNTNCETKRHPIANGYVHVTYVHRVARQLNVSERIQAEKHFNNREYELRTSLRGRYYQREFHVRCRSVRSTNPIKVLVFLFFFIFSNVVRYDVQNYRSYEGKTKMSISDAFIVSVNRIENENAFSTSVNYMICMISDDQKTFEPKIRMTTIWGRRRIRVVRSDRRRLFINVFNVANVYVRR